jgi:DnaJ family protein B protein 12
MNFIFVLLADITAEELFNMFFGGGFHNQNVYTRRGGRWQRAENHAQNREVCSLNACTSEIEMGFCFERQISFLSFV